MRKNKNDYAVIVCYSNGRFKKFPYVHNVYKMSQWLTHSAVFADWHYINVYLRRNREFLGTYKRGSFIPPKP